MRIHRMHLKDFRGVIDREITFDDGVTVVIGPNEVGKSSIAEALSLLLEVKDSSRSARVKDVRPVGRDADPTVELECTTGPYHLVYRKTWATGASRETSLQVLAPAPERETGDEAHERVIALVEETVDAELWAALRVEQSRELGQAELADSSALTDALDATVSNGDAGADDGTLITQVEEAAGEFWTAQGRERDPLKAAETEVEEARREHDRLRAEHDAVVSDVEERDRVEGQIVAWESGLGELERLATETRAAADALTALRRRVEQAEQDAELAGERADAAARAVTERRALVEELERQGEQADAAAEAAREDAAALDGAKENAETLAAVRREAREAVVAARAESEAASRDVRLLRASTAIGPLQRRIEDGTALADRRDEAERVLDGAPPTDADVEELARLVSGVASAQAVLDAGVARLRLTGPAGRTVSLDGEDVALDALGDDGIAIDGERTVGIDDITITATPGTSADDLRTRVERTQAELDDALSSLGVTDLDAARAAAAARRDAERTLRETESAWRQLVGDGGVDGLRRDLTHAEQDVAALQEQRDPARPLPADLAEAEQLAEAAQAAVDTASGRADEATQEAEQAAEVVRDATGTAAASRSLAASLAASVEQAERALAEARERADDEALGAAAAAAGTTRDEAQQELAAARAALAAEDAGGLEAEATVAATRLEQRKEQLIEHRRQLAGIEGRLERGAGAGVAEKLDEAEARLADAVARRDAVRRRADALLLLRDTLRRHRDDARARYVAPLREAIERLGAVVFGDSFGVTLDESLAITQRVLHDVPLPVTSLSGGAQEQLAIITRLAAAQVVDPEDGVPLILDDTLGYADPQRADRVAHLLGRVGQRTQVIVLTCDPDRFAGIPGARTVALT